MSLGRAMAQAVSRRPLTEQARESPRGIAVAKVALGQVLSEFFGFPPASIIPSWLSIRIYHLGDEQ
jgi:hypothetical protein